MSKQTRYEVAKRNADALRECLAAGVTMEDGNNIRLYDEVMALRQQGLKMQYCVNTVSDRYGVSPARIWRALRRLKAKI